MGRKMSKFIFTYKYECKFEKDDKETTKIKDLPSWGKEGRSPAEGLTLCTGRWKGHLALYIF